MLLRGCIAAVSVVPIATCSCTYCAYERQRSDLYREKRHCLRRESRPWYVHIARVLTVSKGVEPR